MSAAEDRPKCESPPSEAEVFGEEQQEEKEYEERERRFDPAVDPDLHNIPHQSLIKFDLETQRSNLTRKCSETGEMKAITSWALYFDPQSRYNKSDTFDWEDFISEEKAEYINLEEALEHICESVSATITQVIIATDSPSLVKLVTEDLTKMARDNDFWRKNPVAMDSIWETLNADQVGYVNEIQLDFRFWFVPKEMNQEAQAMAQSMEDREMQKIKAEFSSYLGAKWDRNAQRVV
ncbi:nad dependent epimerase [Fusarium phyllophilum]|uniref:Nad dependent epimerase n=1 Tax=Fusarium phyllophilum TaxID=47803 RepID=A0A8H5KDL3_9HYPO|nr:nad dependent epimerase [Fusarium phyllophilum]